MVSRTFPAYHPKKGQPTYFVEKILWKLKKIDRCDVCRLFNNCEQGTGCESDCFPRDFYKIHTIRQNVELWQRRISEIQKGNATLSIRYWSGKPYNSKQVEICQLDKDSSVGIQELSFEFNDINYPSIGIPKDIKNYNLETIAKNDGLSLNDFKNWFKNYDLSKLMAIIHFTSFKYR